jgi:hypothetical protein
MSGISQRVTWELLTNILGKCTASILTVEAIPTKLHGGTRHMTVNFTLNTV